MRTSSSRRCEGRVNFTLRLSKDEIAWLKEEAAKDGRPVSNMVRKILMEYREAKTELSPGGIGGVGMSELKEFLDKVLPGDSGDDEEDEEE